jgi:hypothetical protein
MQRGGLIETLLTHNDHLISFNGGRKSNTTVLPPVQKIFSEEESPLKTTAELFNETNPG